MFRLLSVTAAIRILGAGAQLLFTIVVARQAGAAEAGYFFFGYSIFMVLSGLSRLGLDLAVLREVAGPFAARDLPGARHALMSRLPLVFYFSLLVGAALAVSSPFIARWSFESTHGSLLLLSCAIPASAVLGVASEALKACQLAWLGLLFQNLLVPSLMIPALLVTSGSISLSATHIAALLVLASWATAIAAFLAIMQTLQSPGRALLTLFAINIAQVAAGLREARHLAVVSLASVVMQWFGATALGFGADSEAVAGYAVASRLAIAVSIIHSAASSVLGPRMAIAYSSGDANRLASVVQRAGVAISLLTWPALTIMMIWAPEFMSLFGDSYAAYSNSLRILLLGQFVAATIGHSGMVLVMTGKYREARWNSLASMVALVALSLLLVPQLGAPGAAWAMSISVSLGHTMGLVLVRARLGLWTIPTNIDDLRHLRKAGSEK